jgi:glycosyltransferase involved in cell wall biosynthesis
MGSGTMVQALNVLSFNMGSDPAGISVGIARAFRTSDWSVRSLVSMTNYIGYPVDLPWERSVIAEAWQAADVIHLHHGFRSADRMVRGRYAGRANHKPYVVTHHGTIFRDNIRAHLNELRERKAIGTVSTLDLHVASGLEWLPPPVNVEALRAMKQPSTDTIRIAHAPTNRAIKSTEELLDAVKRLQDDGFPVELDLIEHRPWSECLARKAKADIYFDQVILGYGCNALEAWGMGIPVVAGAADETLDEMERRFGHLPFYHATEETIYDALKELVESPELRKRYGKIGHDYVRKYHDEPVVVEQLKRLYRRAMGESMEEAA